MFKKIYDMTEKLFSNIGTKMKISAIVEFIFLAVASLAFGTVMLCIDGEPMWIVLMVMGPCVAFVSSWALYGFGELIEKVTKIEANTRK